MSTEQVLILQIENQKPQTIFNLIDEQSNYKKKVSYVNLLFDNIVLSLSTYKCGFDLLCIKSTSRKREKFSDKTVKRVKVDEVIMMFVTGCTVNKLNWLSFRRMTHSLVPERLSSNMTPFDKVRYNRESYINSCERKILNYFRLLKN